MGGGWLVSVGKEGGELRVVSVRVFVCGCEIFFCGGGGVKREERKEEDGE